MESAAPDAHVKPSNYNVANALTVLRIVGVPVFGWLMLTEGGSGELGGDVGFRLWAFVAFTLLMVTDRIDGDLARKYGLVTNFGKLADPIADKALTGMAFVGLSLIGVLWWWVTILVLVREWGITVMRFFIKSYSVSSSSQAGRIKTTLQAVAIGGYLLPFEIWDNTLSQVLRWVTHVTMAAAVAITLVTAVQYVQAARVARREHLAAGAGRA